MLAYNKRFFSYITGVHYVYVYINPIDSVPFYVGKGKNKRAFVHLTEKYSGTGKSNYSKLNQIKEIKALGLVPEIIFAAVGLSEPEAYELEQFIISTLGTKSKNTGPLTNLVTGRYRFYDRNEKNLETFKKISESLKRRYNDKENPLIPYRRGKKFPKESNGRFKDNRTYNEIHGKDKANALKAKMSLARTGSGNSNASKWKLTSQDGKVYIVTGTLKSFCKENELGYTTLKRNIGKTVKFAYLKQAKFYKTNGWRLDRYEGNL